MSGERELDERVHHEIFGMPTEQRQWCEDWERFVFGPYSRRCARCGTRTSANFSTKSGPCAPPVPRYSQDIAAAWLVVKHMQERGWSFAMWSVCMFSRVPGPIAAFVNSVYPPKSPHGPEPVDGAVYGFGAAMPESICRAALEALAAVRGAADGEAGA